MKGYPTLLNGVIFIEAPVQYVERVSLVSADLSFKIGAQLKNLNDVKIDLAMKAAAMNCNCISDFKYGQKSRWLAFDDVAYFGSGLAVKLSYDSYQGIIDYIQQRDAN